MQHDISLVKKKKLTRLWINDYVTSIRAQTIVTRVTDLFIFLLLFSHCNFWGSAFGVHVVLFTQLALCLSLFFLHKEDLCSFAVMINRALSDH